MTQLVVNGPHGTSRKRRASTFLPMVAVCLAACAGGSGGSSAGKSPAPESPEARAEESDSADAVESEPSPAVADPCADETCFRCGASVCLAGWYCDEKAPSGEACSWLPDCATKPSCECIQRVLGEGCRCDENGTAIVVRCE